MTGKVKWFNNEKGYGFIFGNLEEEDIFVHYSVIESKGFKTLNEGDDVEFECFESTKGLQASKVLKIS